MSGPKIIYDWLDKVGSEVQSLEFEGKSLGFRADLNISVSAKGASTEIGSTLRFFGAFKAFAPLKKAPVIDYQIESEWVRGATGQPGSWRLTSWMDQNEVRHLARTFELSEDGQMVHFVRKPGGHGPHEKNLNLADQRKMAGVTDEVIMDPLTATVFGLTQAADTSSAEFGKLFVLHKSGIRDLGVSIIGDERKINFDKTEILFSEWREKGFSKISVRDARLPFSAVLTRTSSL